MIEHNHEQIDNAKEIPKTPDIGYMEDFLVKCDKDPRLPTQLAQRLSWVEQLDDTIVSTDTIRQQLSLSNNVSYGWVRDYIFNNTQSYKHLLDKALTDITSDEASMMRRILIGKWKEDNASLTTEEKKNVMIVLSMYHIANKIELYTDTPTIDDLIHSTLQHLEITHPEFVTSSKRIEQRNKKEQIEEYVPQEWDISCYKWGLFILVGNEWKPYQVQQEYIPPQEWYDIYAKKLVNVHEICDIMDMYLTKLSPTLTEPEKSAHSSFLHDTIWPMKLQSLYIARLCHELAQSSNPQEYATRKQKLDEARSQWDIYQKHIDKFVAQRSQSSDFFRVLKDINPSDNTSHIRNTLWAAIIRSPIDAVYHGVVNGTWNHDDIAEKIIQRKSSDILTGMESCMRSPECLSLLNSCLWAESSQLMNNILTSSPDTLIKTLWPKEWKADTYLVVWGEEMSSTEWYNRFADMVRKQLPPNLRESGSDMNFCIIAMIKAFRNTVTEVGKEYKQVDHWIDTELMKDTLDNDTKQEMLDAHNMTAPTSIAYSQPITDSEWKSYVDILKKNNHQEYSSRVISTWKLQTSSYINEYQKAKLLRTMDLNAILHTTWTATVTALEIGSMFVWAGAVAALSTGWKIWNRLAKLPKVPQMIMKHMAQAVWFSAWQTAIDWVKWKVQSPRDALNILTSNLWYYAFFLSSNAEFLNIVGAKFWSTGTMIKNLLSRWLRYIQSKQPLNPEQMKDSVAALSILSTVKGAADVAKQWGGSNAIKNLLIDASRVMWANGSWITIGPNGEVVLWPVLGSMLWGWSSFGSQDLINSFAISLMNKWGLKWDARLADTWVKVVKSSKFGIIVPRK